MSLFEVVSAMVESERPGDLQSPSPSALLSLVPSTTHPLPIPCKRHAPQPASSQHLCHADGPSCRPQRVG